MEVSDRYDGVGAAALAPRLAVPRVVTLDVTGSTLDVAHTLGESGATSGTLVLADRQTAGRGRLGRRWESPAGAGIWLTLVERDVDPAAIGLLAIRLGLAAAPVLDAFAEGPVRLKWPNDLHVAHAGGGKLAGILCEARWQGDRLGWVAVGFGLNVAPSGHPGAAALRAGVARLAVLDALVPALRAAAARRGTLGAEEMDAWAARDLARGRRAAAPIEGVVEGIATDGALVVRASGTGALERVHSGSLILEEAG